MLKSSKLPEWLDVAARLLLLIITPLLTVPSGLGLVAVFIMLARPRRGAL